MTITQKGNLERILTVAHQDYAKGLGTHASFRVSNKEVGEDLVQQTFMKTWAYMMRGGEIERMKAFLYHVLSNLIVDEYRKKKTVSLSLLMEKGFDPPTVNKMSIAEILDGKMALLLIERLPLKYRKVVHMKYVGDFSLEEISLVVGLPKNTIAVQIHRGIKIIRSMYKG